MLIGPLNFQAASRDPVRQQCRGAHKQTNTPRRFQLNANKTTEVPGHPRTCPHKGPIQEGAHRGPQTKRAPQKKKGAPTEGPNRRLIQMGKWNKLKAESTPRKRTRRTQQDNTTLSGK